MEIELDSLEKAKNDLRQGWETPDGATCACCGQKVKKYKRKINSMIAYMLVKFYRMPHDEAHHVGEIPMPKGSTTTGRDYAILRYWGVIKSIQNDDPEKKNSGFWQITQVGIDFVEGRVKLPKHAFIYNQKLLSFGEEEITITEALGDKFSYPELMGYLI